jgi:hypothetical protein
MFIAFAAFSLSSAIADCRCGPFVPRRTHIRIAFNLGSLLPAEWFGWVSHSPALASGSPAVDMSRLRGLGRTPYARRRPEVALAIVTWIASLSVRPRCDLKRACLHQTWVAYPCRGPPDAHPGDPPAPAPCSLQRAPTREGRNLLTSIRASYRARP